MDTSGAITWGELNLLGGAVVACGAAVIGAVMWLWKERVRQERETGQRFEDAQKEMTNLRILVAKEYATHEALLKMEERLSDTIKQAIGQIRDQFKDLIDVLRK